MIVTKSRIITNEQRTEKNNNNKLPRTFNIGDRRKLS